MPPAVLSPAQLFPALYFYSFLLLYIPATLSILHSRVQPYFYNILHKVEKAPN